jgi:Curli production assembly/transport component CsgG
MNRRKRKFASIISTAALMLAFAVFGESQRRSGESNDTKGGKPRILVLSSASNNILWTNNVTTAALEDALTQSGRYDVIAGSQRDKVIKEQGFSSSDLVDPKNATAVGKLLTARYIVVGNALDVTVKKKGLGGFSPIDVGSDVKTRVQVQVIDAETGIVKSSKSFEKKANKGPVTGTETDNDAIREAYRKAMEMIAADFVSELAAAVPTEGLIVMVRAGRVALNLGAEQVKVGEEFEVYSDDEPIKGPDGKTLGFVKTKYARLRIAEIEPQLSWATVVMTYDENGAPDSQIKVERIKKNQAARRVK